MSEKFINKIDGLISILIKATIFLLPLFFLLWTSEYFEFNKQFLLRLIMPLALFLWLARQAARGEITIKTNPLNLPIIIFLALTGLSAIFSLDIFSSFFGSYGRFSDGWLGLLSLAIFYFLLINTGLADSAAKIFVLLKLLFYSAGAAAIISLLAMFGATQSLAAGWFNILALPSFNPAGESFLSLAVFLAVMAVLAAGFLFSGAIKKLDRFIFSAGLALFLVVLALINFYLSWIILALGAGLLIIFCWLKIGFSFKKILNYYLLIPIALMLAAVLMLVLPNFSPAKIILGRELPSEVRLDYKTAVLITKNVINKNPIFGSGPATFSQSFSLYRPAELNKNNYWQVRFDKSYSQFLEIPATSGLPALLSWLLVVSLIIYINIILFIKYFKNRQPALADGDYDLITAVFTAFLLLFFAQLFFPVNTVLNFSAWLFAALAIAFWQIHNQAVFKEKIFNLKTTAILSWLWLLGLFLLSALCLPLAFFEIKFFTAEIVAAPAFSSEANLLLAVKLNPNRAEYHIKLAEFYLNRARVEAAKPRGEKDNNVTELYITRSIEAGRRAVLAAPNSVQTHETLAMIYRDVRPLTIGAEIWAVQFFTSALALEPTNPILAAELAKAYLNNNDAASAEKYFIKALELKADYYEAKFGLAKAYLKNKKDYLALNLLNELATEVYDAEIFYELGRFYYNHGEIAKAIDRFKLVLNIAPKHSNSLYSLAVAYEAKGDTEEALKYYNQVLELNPGNEEVIKKIKELSGKSR
ncbi:MAG: tetratricopeptide repeat protein [Patescibacteria group bacterium]|jgi:tetratricopeptide (TPR) repeat protein/O-antigen ligase